MEVSHADLRRGVRAIMADDGAGLDEETRSELLGALLRHTETGCLASGFVALLRERMERIYADRAPCVVDVRATVGLDQRGRAVVTDLEDVEAREGVSLPVRLQQRVHVLEGQLRALTDERDALQEAVRALTKTAPLHVAEPPTDIRARPPWR